MVKRFLLAAIIGILVFLVIYFVLPFALSAPDIVAGFAAGVLELSNRYFDPMPRLLVEYVASMNLPVVAATAALLAMFSVWLISTAWSLAARAVRLAIALLRREPKEEAPRELSAIDIDSKYLRSGEGRGVLGRGLDTIERD